MQKALFGASAILAAFSAGQASADTYLQPGDPIVLSVGGYYIAGVGVGRNEEFGANWANSAFVVHGEQRSGPEKDFHIINDGEIHFTARGTLDNGVGIEVRVELEAYGSGGEVGDMIDEHWMKIKTAFGTILIGQNDTAVDNIAGGLGRTGGGIAGGAWDMDRHFGIGATSYHLGDDGDSHGVHYYSPNISGFEFGVSWQPDTGSDDNCGGATGVSTNCSITNTNDQIAVAAAYSGNFGDVDFAIGGGYTTRDEDAFGGAADEWAAYGVGAELGFGDVTIGGGWVQVDDDDTTPALQAEYTQYGAGIEYVTGPWAFGLSGLMHEYESTTSSRDWEAFLINAAIGVNLADGVDIGAAIEYGESDYADIVLEDHEGFAGKMLLGVKF